uniref:Probable phosphoinositide phosphatase SAC9 n=1 Tax=Tanacetum cinerariifolium TaxID=118510 RepID=A0A6L2NTK8_TANCI|nr:probable phosphoinositide phosphatase SAC9 [Tanacetum cinerariifolium]
MRRVGKGFSGVDTPLFDSMLVQQQVQDVEDAAEDEDDDNKVSPEPTPPSPTPATTPPPPQQESIPSPPQAQTAQPSSPPPQKPSPTVDISQSAMSLLNTLLETCVTMTKQVVNLEQDKIVKAIEITKLKQREDVSKQEGKFAKLDTDEDITLVDVEEDINTDVQGRLAESQAKPAEVEEVIEVVTTAKLMAKVVTTITDAQVPKANASRRRRGVVIQDPKETATASVIVHTENEAFAAQLKAELNADINWDNVMEQVKRKENPNNTVMRYQALKRKPVTKAQARKNMMIYLKNMVGFKMDFFKGSNLEQDIAKKQRIDEEAEELKTHLQIVVNDDDDVFTEATPLASKVSVVDYQIHHENNKTYYKIIRADETHKLFLSFITLLNKFDREDLEILWKLVQERFQSSKPKNFSDDFLLNTFKIMFEKPNVEANIWRDQKDIYGLAKVKSWKLFKSCRVYIITLITTQLILLVEKKYPLTRFTLEQMLNNIESTSGSVPPLSLLAPLSTGLRQSYWRAQAGTTSAELIIVLGNLSDVSGVVLLVSPCGYSMSDLPTISTKQEPLDEDALSEMGRRASIAMLTEELSNSG